MSEVMSEKDQYLAQIAIYALVSLSSKPQWTTDEHSKFFFKTMDKKTDNSKLEHFYNELRQSI